MESYLDLLVGIMMKLYLREKLFGAHGFGSDFFEGAIDDVRIYENARALQIQKYILTNQ